MDPASIINQERLDSSYIQQKSYVRQYSERIWRGSIKRSVKLIFNGKERRAMAEARAWYKALKELEASPVAVPKEPGHKGQLEALARVTEGVADTIAKLSRVRSTIAQKYHLRLQRHLSAIICRYGCVEDAPDETIREKIHQEFRAWKERLPFPKAKVVHDWELAKLDELARYPGFCESLMKNRWWMRHVFGWLIYPGCPVEVIAKYPHLADKLRRTLISRRAGYFNDGGLRTRITTNPLGYRQEEVQLCFAKVMQNIQNPKQKISIGHAPRITVKEAFDEFAKKHFGANELEYFSDSGIVYHNAYEWARALDDGDWRKLPCVQVLNGQQVKDKFGVDLKDDEFAIGVGASRTTVEIQLTQNHGYTVGIRPLGGGKFQIYPFGLYMKIYHPGALKAFFNSMRTVPGAIAYFDESLINMRRDHIFFMTPCEGKDFEQWMQLIIADSRRSLDDNLPFNFWEYSCIEWAMGLLRKVLGERFEEPTTRIHVLDPRINNPIARTLRVANRVLPEFAISWIINFFSIPLGALQDMQIETDDGEIICVGSHRCEAWWRDKTVPSPQALWPNEEDPCTVDI